MFSPLSARGRHHACCIATVRQLSTTSVFELHHPIAEGVVRVTRLQAGVTYGDQRRRGVVAQRAGQHIAGAGPVQDRR